MNSWSTMFLIERILALALLQQTVELLIIRKAWVAGGIWSWSILKTEHSGFKSLFTNLFLNDLVFTILLLLRICLAITLFFSPPAILLWMLLAISLLILVRWRGTFNGGSDAMTSIVLLALCLSSSFPKEIVLRGCLWYIAIQVCLSYFIAGFQKIRLREWRTGQALQGFLSSTTLDIPDSLRLLVQNPRVSFGLSWLLMMFECLFPLALLNSNLCALFILGGVIFHVLNTYAMGLNRFILAWLAAYPALYFCSQIW